MLDYEVVGNEKLNHVRQKKAYVIQSSGARYDEITV
jgi:FMN-dependent NADH-azoreductase